jgi:nuclear pore complex protein Nup107
MLEVTLSVCSLLPASYACHTGGRYEAALYGVLAGYLPAVLPVCSTWEDACWAYCRAWLDNAADAALEQEQAAVTALQRGTGLLVSVDPAPVLGLTFWK